MSTEREDLVSTLQRHRGFLKHTVEGLTEEQARLSPTASELSLGGLIKHVTTTEQAWADFVVDGPSRDRGGPDIDWENIDWNDPPEAVRKFQENFRMLDDETLSGLLEAYDEVAAATDDLVSSVDLDARQPLPEAPWFEPGATWSSRRVFLHITAETAQHAGHADIIRETIDGQKTMG